MNKAKELSLDSEYVFIHYLWMDGMKDVEELWNGPSQGQWDNLILMNIKLPSLEDYRPFIQETVCIMMI